MDGVVLVGKRIFQSPLWFFFIILLFLNLPNFIPLETSQSKILNWLEFLERLLQSVLISAVLLALFARAWVAWAVLWLFILWWQPVSVVVRWVNETPLTAALVGMGMATSPGELIGLGALIPFHAILYFVVWNLLGLGVLLWLIRQKNMGWGWLFRGRVVLVSIGLLLLPHISDLVHGGRAEFNKSDNLNSELLGRFKSADEPIEGGGLLANAFPYELPFSFFQYWRARQVVNDVREKFGSLPSENVFNVSVDSPEVVVLVIGESSSRRAWHLFDSEVEMTTPLLESRLHVRGLYPLSNVVAQSVSTRQSVPSMLTSQPLIWPDGTANENATQSIVSAAANAGYMTAWFSNQAAVGEHDGVVSTYAQEAHISAFLNPSGFWMKGSYDDVLLMPLERYLRNNVRVFVVMHTMGSHFDFSHRYPPGFGVFPFAEGVKETYLNSISYTDWFLEQVILMLERDGRSAVLLYASDHGQGLPGGECKRDRINRLSREAYEVPVFIWLSRSYESSHPAVAGLLKKNENFPYTLAAIPQTVVDLVNGVAVFGKGCEDKQSFLRVQFGDSPQSIAIAPGRWVDFRRAVLRNPCSLFID